MAKGRYTPPELPTGRLVGPRLLRKGDRIQRPRGAVFVIDSYRWPPDGSTVLTGHYEVSGYRKTITVLPGESVEDWGFIEEGE